MARAVDPNRVPCCVPHCRRTRKPGGGQFWICGIHWRFVPMAVKAEYRLVRKRTLRILDRRPQYRDYWKLPPGSPQRLRAHAMWMRVDQVLEKCKRAAIERAMGI